LTIGKTSNAADMSVSSLVNIAGPVSIYGGKITLNADLTTGATSGTGMLLQGAQIVQAAGVDVITSGANISYALTNSPWTAVADYGIYLTGTSANKATVNAAGGNVSMTASYATTGTSGGYDRLIELDNASIKTSGAGTVTITSDGSNNGNGAGTDVWAVGFNTSTAGTGLIQTENGAITLTGTAGKLSANSRGIVAQTSALSILSASGAITLKDIQPAGTTGSYFGMYLRANSTGPHYYGSDGTTVLSGTSTASSSQD
jgi:hypothetical protein